MSFTPQSSLSAMSRLGRTKGLLDRKRLDNGNTLMGRIVSIHEWYHRSQSQKAIICILRETGVIVPTIDCCVGTQFYHADGWVFPAKIQNNWV